MKDLARIREVDATGPSTLAVTWSDGTASAVDLAGWIARGGQRFAALGNALVFALAEVGLYGGNVTWDGDEGDLAIDAEHLRMLAEHQAPFDAAAAAAWQAEAGVSNAEAADLLGVARSTWAGYRAGAEIPDTVGRLCRALRSDPAALAAHLRPRAAGSPGGGPIYADAGRAARLRWREQARAITQDWPTLQEAVLAFYRLPDGKQDAASIALPDDGTVYKAPAIRRLHYGPEPDGEDAIRSTLARGDATVR